MTDQTTNWVEKDKKQLHPVCHPKSHANPLVIERAEGVQLNVTAIMTLNQVRAVSIALTDHAPSYISVFAGWSLRPKGVSKGVLLTPGAIPCP